MNEYRLSQKHKKSNLEMEQWTVYSIADLVCASIIVLIAVCDAHPQRFRYSSRQTAPAPAPYPAAGYRPSGAQFALPQKEYGTPVQAYGPPPPAAEQPLPTTTELPETTTNPAAEEVTTLEPQVENIRQRPNSKQQATPVLLVLSPSRTQNYVRYVVRPAASADLQADEVIAYAPQSAGLYATQSGELQTIPVATVYNPYSYFPILH